MNMENMYRDVIQSQTDACACHAHNSRQQSKLTCISLSNQASHISALLRPIFFLNTVPRPIFSADQNFHDRPILLYTYLLRVEDGEEPGKDHSVLINSQQTKHPGQAQQGEKDDSGLQNTPAGSECRV